MGQNYTCAQNEQETPDSNPVVTVLLQREKLQRKKINTYFAMKKVYDCKFAG